MVQEFNGSRVQEVQWFKKFKSLRGMKKSESLGMALLLICLCAVSCVDSDSSIDDQIIGEWKLVSISSEINNVQENQNDGYLLDSDVYYTFKADSTYQILDGDYEELGRWELNDSTLTMCADDTLGNSEYKILRLDADSLFHESYSDSEFGVIHELMKFIRIAQ